MKFFLDTASIEQISMAAQLGILDGVTTNPTLMAKEGIKGADNIKNHYLEISKIVKGPVNAEVLSSDYDSMVSEGMELAAIHQNIIVKIPCITDGLRAINTLQSKGVRTNCTLVFNPGQAMLAAKAGASYVSPFIGRLDDIGADGIFLVKQIVDIFAIYKIEAEVIAASIRSSLNIVKSMEAGADIATCPLNTILAVMKHPLTDNGLKTFMEDAAKMKE